MEEGGNGKVQVDGRFVNALVQNTKLLQDALISIKNRTSDNIYFPIGQEKGFDEMDAANENDTLSYERQSRIEKNLNDRAFESLIIITLFSFFCILLMTFYVGIYWLNFNMIHGYPAIAVPPSPGPFVSQRYTFMYFCVYLLGINFIPPIALMIAGNIPTKISGIFFHQMTTILAFIINIFSGLSLLLLYWWFCNGAGATMSVLANDVSWCCIQKHYAENPVICPISMSGCIAGSIMTKAELTAAFGYVLSMVVALVFFVLSVVHLQLNGSLGTWGTWRTDI